MNKSAENVGQLLNYEKFSNINLLGLPKVEKKDIPDYIQCPKYNKAKQKMDKTMERYTGKVDRLKSDLRQMKRNIEEMIKDRSDWQRKANAYCDTSSASSVARQNHAAENANRLLDKIEAAQEKHDDLIDRIKEAEDEASEKLEELTLETLEAIDDDIPMVINRIADIVSNLASSEEPDDLLAALDICLIGLRIHALFNDLIDDNNARKESKEGIAKINQYFSSLCAEEKIKNYMVDIYLRNLDLIRKNALISQQIDDVVASVDQTQLDVLSKYINTVLAAKVETKFDYIRVIDPAEINRIVEKIKNAIDSLKLNIEKAKSFQAVGTQAVTLGKAGVNADQQAKSLRDSMQKYVDALDGPLEQNHFAVQIIDEAVIEDFYQKDLRVAATALRKHLVDTIGEDNFKGVIKAGDDRFSLKKGQTAIDKANLTRLQSTLDKIPRYIKEQKDQITSAETDIEKANEVPKKNADALNAELASKYGIACIPVIGFSAAIGIHNRVQKFEAAFRGTNQIYKDLGSALLEKNKKMNIVALIINAIIGIGSLLLFAIIGGPVVISIIVLASCATSFLMLFMTEKKLASYLGISMGSNLNSQAQSFPQAQSFQNTEASTTGSGSQTHDGRF